MAQEPAPLAADEASARKIAAALKLEPFFPEFTAEHLAKLFPRSALLRYPAEAPLVRQGEAGRDLFILCSGKAAVYKTLGSAGAHLATLGPGDIVGEIALLQDGTRVASVIAAEECVAFRLRHEDILYLLRHNRELSEHLQRLAQQRLEI